MPAQCVRCGGCLLPDYVPVQPWPARLVLWRCVACGDRIDARILRHRQLQQDILRVFYASGRERAEAEWAKLVGLRPPSARPVVLPGS